MTKIVWISLAVIGAIVCGVLVVAPNLLDPKCIWVRGDRASGWNCYFTVEDAQYMKRLHNGR